MPPKVFWAYVQMMTRLKAEKSLADMQAIAAGTGNMTADGMRQLRRQLLTDANGGRMPRAPKATAAGLAAMGIRVTTVE